MTDRGPGILTQKQREFIRLSAGERREEFSRRVRYRYRKRIRDRIANAMADFRLLNEFDRDFATDEVEEAFSGSSDGDEVSGAAYVPTALRFFARALDEDDEVLYSLEDAPRVYDRLLDGVEKAIERDAAERKETVLSFDLSAEVSGAETAELALERLEKVDVSTTEKLRLVSLLQEAGFDQDRIAEAAPELFDSDE